MDGKSSRKGKWCEKGSSKGSPTAGEGSGGRGEIPPFTQLRFNRPSKEELDCEKDGEDFPLFFSKRDLLQRGERFQTK